MDRKIEIIKTLVARLEAYAQIDREILAKIDAKGQGETKGAYLMSGSLGAYVNAAELAKQALALMEEEG